jgi:hypothetical protein
MIGKINSYRILAGNLSENGNLEDREQEDNINMDFKKAVFEKLAQDRVLCSAMLLSC